MVATIRIEILGNARDAQNAAREASGAFDKFGSAMGTLAVPAGVAAGAIGVFAKGATDAASQLQQSSGSVAAVFGQSAAQVQTWAADSAQAVGMSTAAYQQMAAGVGGALTGMGVSQSDAAASTHDLMLRAADLASVFGGTAQEATAAMTSAFRGEYDSLQRLIPSINAAAIEQKMAEEASKGLTFASEDAARAHAITATIMEDSAAAAGNFAKEAGTAEGAQQRATAEWENAQATLGTKLLPALTTLTQLMADAAKWISENSTLVLTLAGIIGGLAIAVLAINGAMALYSAATTVAAAVTAAWSAASSVAAVATAAFGTAMAILTSPITIIIAIIAAVIAAIVLLVKNWDTVKEAALVCWEAIKAAVEWAWDGIKSVVGGVVDWFKGVWDGIAGFMSGVWDGIKQAASVAWEAIKTIALGPIGIILKVLEAFGIDAEDIWNGIKNVAVSCWNAIKSALDTLMTPFRWIKDAIQWLITKLKEAWDWAVKVISKIPFVGDMIGATTVAAPAVTSAAAVPMVGGRAVAAGGGVTININGALDPVGVGRQVGRLLRAEQRRTRGVSIA